MTWHRYFDPQLPPQPESTTGPADGLVYDFDDATVLAVNVALVTGRPLLVRGPPGCGKSTLAPAVARRMGWRYLEHVVTSRTQARDLLWTFDEVRRLSDAQTGQVRDDRNYVTPGPLWWAYDAPSAAEHAPSPLRVFGAIDHAARGLPALPLPETVLLLDEIDKADPDVPNDLLGVLSTWSFQVRGRDAPVRCPESRRPFVVVTTNDERELPGAFRRRCVQVDLDYPAAARLEQIGAAHLAHRGDPPAARLLTELAARTRSIGEERLRASQRPPGVSEFLDALYALLGLVDHPDTALDHPIAKAVLAAALDKEAGRA